MIEHFVERRKKPWGRSAAEIVIAIAAVIGMAISIFTGVRAFYVNEYRIDQLEGAVKDVRSDVKDARADIKDMNRSVDRLVGAASNNGWTDKFNDKRRP